MEQKMCVTSAYTFIDKELHEFSGDVGSGFFDSFSFKGVSLSRIHGCVNNSVEIFKAKKKTFLSIHICLSGSVQYSVEQMIEPYQVGALEIKIISGELSGIKSTLPADKKISEISIFLDEDAYKELIQTSDVPDDDSARFNGDLNISSMEMAYANFLYLLNLPHPKNQFECVALQGYCYVAIGEVINRFIKNDTSAVPAKRMAAERIKSLLDSDLKNNKTIRQLANFSGTNECYLKKEFKALTGCSIADYRQKQRIRHARNLLQRGFLSIDSLATEVGYKNPHHFVSVFRRHTGVHPKEYKLEEQ
jgi:AraC-like DNA-binding protein